MNLPTRALLSLVLAFLPGAFALGAPPAPAPALTLGATALKSPSLAKKIILIGGKNSHADCEHDLHNGLPLIASWLKASPAFAAADVLTYTGGWPADPAVLDGTSTIVLCFDGAEESPAPPGDPARIALLQKQIDSGVGLIALHQASAVPAGDATIPLLAWLGAKHDGPTDRAADTVKLAPVAPDHPVFAGVGEFTTTDAFSPTLTFAAQGVVPILRAPLASPASHSDAILAWAFERAGGGRSFGYTGGQYLAALQDPTFASSWSKPSRGLPTSTCPPQALPFPAPLSAPPPSTPATTTGSSRCPGVGSAGLPPPSWATRVP